MERSNQPPKTEGCLAEGEPVDLWFYRKERPSRSVSTGKREPQAGPASGLSNSASKAQTQAGTASYCPNPKPTRPLKVRAGRACRGLRAWRAPKETHGTKETRRVPAALTARAKQEGRRNDKKRLLALRESDWLIVASSKAQAPKLVKGPTVNAVRTGNQDRKNDGTRLANLPMSDRRRVWLKSPVRENRPPGSVRGAPGNRRPYRDKVRHF